MGIVCFAFAPDDASLEECNRLNAGIVTRVNASGDAYLTRTTLRDRVCMRIGIGNVLTTEAHLRHVWERVRAEATGAR